MRGKKRLLILVILLTAALAGCTVIYGALESPGPDSVDRANSPTPPAVSLPPEDFFKRFPSPGLEPLSLTELTWSEELETAAGRLHVSVSLPQAEGTDDINAYYEARLEDLQAWASAFSEWAEGEHTLESQYQVECNQDGLLSVTHRQALDGVVTVSAQTFEAETGRRLNMEDLFATKRDVYTDILSAEVLTQLSARSIAWGEDTETLVRECFPYDTFCVTPEGMALLYPPQTLAGDQASSVRFDIPYSVFLHLW